VGSKLKQIKPYVLSLICGCITLLQQNGENLLVSPELRFDRVNKPKKARGAMDENSSRGTRA